MNIAKRIADDYNIHHITDIKDISSSNDCYLVGTAKKSYVYKSMGRLDFLEIYTKVEKVLNDKGLVQARVIPNSQGELMSEDGYSLYEYIPGEPLEEFTDQQFEELVKYLNRYNTALQQVPFKPTELKQVNNWDKMRSLRFMLDNIEPLIAGPSFDNRARNLLRSAGKVLTSQAEYLSNSQKQLIHADLGPGNILFSDNKVKAIIDFTPDYENVLYSLAQFLYWTCLWNFEQGSLQRINATLEIYCGSHDLQLDSNELFIYLVKACLFRIMGPALNMLENKGLAMEKLQHRLLTLETLLDIRYKI